MERTPKIDKPHLVHERGDGRVEDEGDEEEEGEDADDAERAEHERDVILEVLEAAAAVVGHGVLQGEQNRLQFCDRHNRQAG